MNATSEVNGPGDVARADGGLINGTRESAQVGMSYKANQRITGRVAVGAERAEGAARAEGAGSPSEPSSHRAEVERHGGGEQKDDRDGH